MGEFRTYLSQSKAISVGLVAVLPLLAIYELGLIAVGSGVEVHAGALMKRMLAVLGGMGPYLALTCAVTISFFLALVIKYRGEARSFRLYGTLILESALYALLLAPVVFWIESGFGTLAAGVGKGGDLGIRLLLGAGAGVWEELLFRLLILGGGLWLTVVVLNGNRVIFGILLLLLSSLTFSALHHIGAHADPFESGIFLYRFLAGLLLGGIFLVRGLGVCVYTHALYNVLTLVFYFASE